MIFKNRCLNLTNQITVQVGLYNVYVTFFIQTMKDGSFTFALNDDQKVLEPVRE